MRLPRISKMLSVLQVAERLGVSPRTVHRWIVMGDLRSHKCGRSRKISEEDLAEFINENRE